MVPIDKTNIVTELHDGKNMPPAALDVRWRSGIWSGRTTLVLGASGFLVYLVLFVCILFGNKELALYAAAASAIVLLIGLAQLIDVYKLGRDSAEIGVLRRRIRGIYAASRDAICLLDLNGDVNQVSDAFVTLTGFDRTEITRGLNYFDLTASECEEDRGSVIDEIIGSKTPVEREKVLVRKDGTRVTVLANEYAVRSSNGHIVALATIMHDITERRSLERKLTIQALHDPLTNLPNRILFRNRVAHALERSNRNHLDVGILYLDLDDFKKVNDTLGHAAGDSLLLAVAERIESCKRAGDTAARLGGDEFPLIVELAASPDTTIHVAERIREALRPPFVLEGKDYFIGTSIGIATSADGVSTPEELLRNADVAMYTAKHGGKDRYAIFEPTMRESILREAQMESDIREGIYREEFEVYYQPIVHLDDERIMGMEALVRWNHPSLGLLSPADFLATAEKTGLIIPLGRWIIHNACLAVREWQIQSGRGTELTLTVNISARQFSDKDLVNTIADALAMSDLPPQTLVVEVMESTLLIDHQFTLKRLDELKELGVRIAIDDFAIGYSALTYLHTLPVDILKIDRSFISRVDCGRDGAAVASAIVNISNTLDLMTIAEGISNETQHSELQSLGCEFGQGFHFAHPLHVSEMTAFLTRHTIDSAVPNNVQDKVPQPASGSLSIR